MNLFGTDGIRTKVGSYPLSPDSLPAVGNAIARWALEKYGAQTAFLVASDTRASCDQIKSALFSAFAPYSVGIYDTGVLPTPAVFHRIAHDNRFTCGIIISASHNTAEDNGIKLVDSVTGKLTLEDELIISSFITAEDRSNGPHTPLPTLQSSYTLLTDAQEVYSKAILDLFPSDLLKGKTVVIDCAHGATYRVAPYIFSALGADLIVLHDKPDGSNINRNCGATHLESLQQAVLAHKAFMGIAFDGDADRCMGVTRSGKALNGDDILALLLTHPTYSSAPALVSTVMANQGFEVYLSSLGKKLIRTSVGDKHVMEALIKHALPLGGEPSGHIIMAPLSNTGDGILVALKMLETILLTGNYDCTTFDTYPQVCINLNIKEKKDLTKAPFAGYIAASTARLTTGRLLVRYSGTEPLVRIMVEDTDQALCSSVARALARQLQPLLS